MMTVADIQNAIIFMKRVTATGEECCAWAQTYQALHIEIAAAQAPPVATPAAEAVS